MAKVLIIGGGMAGCCAAQLLSEKGFKITLIESSPYLGGGCRTFFYGGHPYTFGPRHFLTKEDKLFDFLNQYVPMRRIEKEQYNLSYVEKDASFYTYPFHRDDVDLMPEREQIINELDNLAGVESASNMEEYWIGSIGSTLYNKYVNNYSKKMWKISSTTELDGICMGWRGWAPKGFALKTGTKAAWIEGISAFPFSSNGYNDYFDIATKNADIHLNAAIDEYDVENRRVKILEQWLEFDIIISTISPEILLNNAFGPLRWIGRDFLKIVLPVEEVYPSDVYHLYYVNEEPFTRIVEYKKYYRYKSPTTLIGIEIPSFNNKLYPYTTRKDQKVAKKYLDALPNNVFSIGRAGTYLYLGIDDIIRQCMELSSKL